MLYQDAWRRFADLRLTFSLARSQLECVCVAPLGDRLAETAAAEARASFEAMGAGAYVVQLDALLAERANAGLGDQAGATAGASSPSAPVPS